MKIPDCYLDNENLQTASPLVLQNKMMFLTSPPITESIHQNIFFPITRASLADQNALNMLLMNNTLMLLNRRSYIKFPVDRCMKSIGWSHHANVSRTSSWADCSSLAHLNDGTAERTSRVNYSRALILKRYVP